MSDGQPVNPKTTTKHIETLAIHAGYTVEPTTKAVAVPIYHTSSYAFDDTQHAADLFDLKVAGNIYTRIMNPTNAVLEERVAAMEGGVGGLAVASGMAAITYTVQTICEMGDNIVTVSTLYGGTYNLFAHTLPRQGIEVRFFDHTNPEAIRDLIDDKTKMIFAESIGNPLGNIVDIQALSDIAHEYGVPLVIDNTVATPAICRPFDFGADIVVHALTKYMSGTGTSIGGAIIDSGRFPWGDYPERFPLLNTPDVSYHGVNFVQDIGAAAFIARARVAPLRNTGAALSPLNAFSIMQGMETLSLRMERHVQNAQAVAEYLRDHDKVAWVKYAGLPDHPDYELAQRYMKGTPSAILTFGVKGGREAGAHFIDALQLFTRLVNIGDAKSLACHPATTTHRQLNEQELAQAGVSEDMVRLSIGIEHIDDIKADLAQALAAA
ncbi:O-acetylhomoserine aminocarboxypropyltransferase/cysteine synthase family protein [Psychrobacter sp. GP33]|uniref:O-acetylhomoserine aminocarboxypropyltransferase/cysteine synthase family protein n=1 Tax=Psychrobacter sp. GP33 TaxID=2758709 RepID=UPI0015F7C919|nr:aminotransferase class I/II-fold pyridoxal phosphate-dependent enzyme [Psychrobacter sp. GP33]